MDVDPKVTAENASKMQTNHFPPLILLGLIVILLLSLDLKAQDYIAASGVHGSSGNDYVTDYLVHDDNLFLIGRTTGADFQTTDGSSKVNSFDYFFIRYDTLMNLQESRLIGGNGSDTPWETRIVGNHIYIFGVVTGAGMPTTIGNGFGGVTDVHILKLDLNGNFVAGTYLGGTIFEFLNDVEIVNGYAHVVINSSSSDFPVTGASTNYGGDDIVYAQIDLTDLSVNYATFLGGSDLEFGAGIEIDGNNAYIGYTTRSIDLPVTNGSLYAGGPFDMAMTAIDINTKSILAMTYLGGSNRDEFIDMEVNNGQVYIQGNSNSVNFTVTNGSSPQATDNIVYTSFDANLNIQTSAYLLGAEVFDKNLEYHNGFLYMTAYTGGNNVNVIKADLNGGVVWNYTGITNLDDLSDLLIYNDKVHIVTTVYDPYLVSTNGSYLYGQEDFYYTTLSLDGNVEFASYYGGIKRDGINFMLSDDFLQVSGSKVWLSGHSEDCFPITNGSTHSGLRDLPAMLIETCPNTFIGDPTPATSSQTVCKNGFVTEIQVDPFLISGTSLPDITTCGIPLIQKDLEASYQWQTASSNTGPWTNIPGAIQPFYTPQPLSVSTCFRRLAKESACCGDSILQVSGVHCVTIGPNEAPYVETGGIYSTCPGIPITMNAIVSGGTPPYQYAWAAGNGPVLDTLTQLTVTPTTAGSVIYTLTVTDALGCRQIDQSAVNAYLAQAGPDESYCEGQPGAVIGGTPIPGLSGVLYNWSPATGLSCTTCPNPIATPSSITSYVLTLTIPISGGGTCSTMDTVTVFPITGPGQNFAGNDRVVCFGDTVHIGASAVSGYSYFWSPGSYLTNNASNPTVFNHGNVSFPDPNPTVYTLTAYKQGCYWYDQMEVAVIRASVGGDTLCGPKFIGEGDLTPTINETWQWTQLAGDGMILGPTNTPETSVSSSTNTTSLYELAVSYNGKTCLDTAVVPPCVGDGSGAVCKAKIESNVGCPSLTVYSQVCLQAYPSAGPPGPYTYEWSPQIGLDTFAGAVVCLTDTIPRTYTVILTNVLDTSIVCSASILVNNPAWSKPVFSALDTIGCPYDQIQIGAPAVSGYGYTWTPQTNISNPLIADPVVSVSFSTDFSVIVTDSLSGCTLRDTSNITISGTPAKGGPDKLVCNTSILTLGYPLQPNTLYSWTPATANWQNGTDQNSAQPQVLVGVNTTFVLTTTDTISGCMYTDTVEVEIGNPILPFILPNMSYCPSQPNLVLGVGVPGGGAWTYNWSPTINMNDPTLPSPTVSPPPANGITYTLVMIDTTGCSYQTTQLITPIVPSPIVGPAQSICVGETIHIGSSLNPTGQGIVYSWFPTTHLSDPNSPHPTFTAVSAGTYVYTLTVNKNGCINSGTITVDVNEFPLMINPKTVCEGSCINIGVPAVPGGTYNWFPTSGLDNPSSSNPLACVTSDIVYTLIATGPTGCENTVQVPVFTNPNVAPQVTIDTVTACLGTSGNFIFPTVTPPGAYTYNWAPNNGSLLYSTSPIPELVLTTPGTFSYQVTVTNANSGCATETSATVIVEACDSSICNLNALITPVLPPCEIDGNGLLEAQVYGGTIPFTYDWSNGGNTPIISNLPVGLYTLTVTDASGCIITNEALIAEDPIIDLVVRIDNASCNPGSDGQLAVNVTGGVPGYTYQWDSGQSSPTLTGLPSGMYSLSVTDSKGCRAAFAAVVGIKDCCPPNACHEAIMGHVLICDTLNIDPSQPLGMLDCDGDGVSNIDECGDSTDPQDPCDYKGTSITLPVTADQTECPEPCPDLTPIVRIVPGNIAGLSFVEVAVQITEIDSVNSDGSIITVRIPSDPRLLFVWDIGLTQAALVPVQNADWNYLGNTGIVHNWTFNGAGLVIPHDSTVAFGFQAFYDPQVTDGQTTLTATVIPFSGGECNILNNSDSEQLVYFE